MRFNQDQINEQHHEVVLDILVGEFLAPRTLCKSHALSQRAVVRLRVFGIEGLDGVATLYADGHSCAAIGEALRMWRWGAELELRARCLELGARVEFRRVTSSDSWLNAMRTIHNS